MTLAGLSIGAKGKSNKLMAHLEDVSGPDGRYLGHVMTPDGFSTDLTPVFRGDHMWAVTTGELDMPTVVRYRIELPTT